jgi:MFS family permease
MPIDGISDSSNSNGFQAASSLWNRTYVGLLIAQFLAAFNDQAIHASAMFFAINTQTLSEAKAISLMPILFYAPWAIFCTIAGYLADRYTKRASLVFWKFAEIAITALALLGFYLGSHGMNAVGSWIVLSTVFMMGTHSAFFVPAKYGVMPEILQPGLLSKGNGLLESLSFLAVILGTVSGGVLSFLFLREETIIGVILLTLAVIGALASLLIRRMPPANATRPFPSYIYGPLWKSIKMLFSSRPLIFAVIGLAFFTFIVAFMRATVYMLGESQNPRWDELRTSAIVGTVALGIGLGSPLAGWLSGRKIELGLIPLGAAGMMVGCAMASLMLDWVPGLVAFIMLIGFSTGFYLVPLFTLLQYRAPKSSKGDMVATSNFINVTGAIIASALFFVLVSAAKKTGFVEKVAAQDHYADGNLSALIFQRGRPVYFEVTPEDGKPIVRGGRVPDPNEPQPSVMSQIFGDGHPLPGGHPVYIDLDRGVGRGQQVCVSRFELHGVEHLDIRAAGDPLESDYDAAHLPRFLFLGAGLMTLVTLLVLMWRLPDLPSRALLVWRSVWGRRRIVDGTHLVPSTGPVVFITNANEPVVQRTIVAASDRYTKFFTADPSQVDAAIQFLQAGGIVAVCVLDTKCEDYLGELKKRLPEIEWMPVFGSALPPNIKVRVGERVPGPADLSAMRTQIENLANP